MSRATLLAVLGFVVQFAAAAPASATWSIIVLDTRTGRIAVGAASCTSDVHGIVALIPGSGALVAQAIGNPDAMREAIRLLRDGVSPDSVLRSVTGPTLDGEPQDRQYGIATFAGGHVQFTGTSVRGVSGERSENGVLVQGNTLASVAVLDRAMASVQAALAAGRPLEEVVMEGLKAGAEAGGDSRCGEQRATSAFVSVAKPGDVPNWPYLTLRIVGVEPGTSVNAVTVLETRLALWQRTGGPRNELTSETIRPSSGN